MTKIINFESTNFGETFTQKKFAGEYSAISICHQHCRNFKPASKLEQCDIVTRVAAIDSRYGTTTPILACPQYINSREHEI